MKIIKQVPWKRNIFTLGWDNHIKNLCMVARYAHLLWNDIGKPRLGVVYDIMQQARSNFKHAL